LVHAGLATATPQRVVAGASSDSSQRGNTASPWTASGPKWIRCGVCLCPCFTDPEDFAIERRLQWVAPTGVVSSVRWIPSSCTLEGQIALVAAQDRNDLLSSAEISNISELIR
jgi:hypothetical protein